MKKILMALAAALLIAAQLLSPAAAASDCGSTYTVQHNDNLSKIAAKCGITVADILWRNPQITNPNVIFTGQVLKLTGSGPTSGSTYSVSYTVKDGDTLNSIATAFGISVWSIKLANPDVLDTGKITIGQKLVIPSPYPAYYQSSAPQTGARVTVSASSAKPGGKVTVYVYGFPAKASIDYRVAQVDKSYSAAYDGTIDSDGEASLTIVIPYSATKGQYWHVLVTTTSQVQPLDVYSPTIYITD